MVTVRMFPVAFALMVTPNELASDVWYGDRR
jgi:hypothetical protein